MKIKDKFILIWAVGMTLGFIAVFLIFSVVDRPVTTKDVYQYIDHDARVVCYILKNGNGISCLPLSEVNISE